MKPNLLLNNCSTGEDLVKQMKQKWSQTCFSIISLQERIWWSKWSKNEAKLASQLLLFRRGSGEANEAKMKPNLLLNNFSTGEDLVKQMKQKWSQTCFSIISLQERIWWSKWSKNEAKLAIISLQEMVTLQQSGLTFCKRRYKKTRPPSNFKAFSAIIKQLAPKKKT